MQVTESTVNTSSPALVTSDYKVYPPSCFKDIISKTLAKSNKPFVLFIHGRGQHPSKALKNKLISKIEKQYDVSVLMFTWPSWSGLFSFPEQKAKSSNKEFLNLLQIVQDIKNKRNESRTFSLLTHSMGSIVLEGKIDYTINNLQNGLFNNIIISASASALKSHSQWVDKISYSKNIYIVSNMNDSILARAEKKLSTRLGKNKSHISKEARYIDLTSSKLGKVHRYYVNQKTKVPRVFDFYDDVFHGQYFD